MHHHHQIPDKNVFVKKMDLTPNTPSSSLNQINPFQAIPFVSPSSTPKFVHNNSHENKRRVVNYDDTDNC